MNDLSARRGVLDHEAWFRVKMEILILDALSDLENVEDAAGRYGLTPDTPKYLRRIMAVCRNVLTQQQEN